MVIQAEEKLREYSYSYEFALREVARGDSFSQPGPFPSPKNATTVVRMTGEYDYE